MSLSLSLSLNLFLTLLLSIHCPSPIKRKLFTLYNSDTWTVMVTIMWLVFMYIKQLYSIAKYYTNNLFGYLLACSLIFIYLLFMALSRTLLLFMHFAYIALCVTHTRQYECASNRTAIKQARLFGSFFLFIYNLLANLMYTLNISEYIYELSVCKCMHASIAFILRNLLVSRITDEQCLFIILLPVLFLCRTGAFI